MVEVVEAGELVWLNLILVLHMPREEDVFDARAWLLGLANDIVEVVGAVGG